jgi:hypothetical protein
MGFLNRLFGKSRNAKRTATYLAEDKARDQKLSQRLQGHVIAPSPDEQRDGTVRTKA